MLLHSQHRSTFCIAAGLLIVCAAQFESAWPIATGVALIGQGACLHTSERWPGAAMLTGLQLVVYSGLTMLFIGARLHQMETEPSSFGWLGSADILLAGGIMAITIFRILSPVRRYYN